MYDLDPGKENKFRILSVNGYGSYWGTFPCDLKPSQRTPARIRIPAIKITSFFFKIKTPVSVTDSEKNHIILPSEKANIS